jgi:triacylglycerol lipase
MSTPKPIHTILVPGWLDNVRTLGRLRTFLEVAGHKAVICSPQPSDGSAPIERLAEQLHDYIEGGFGKDEPINLFGFSMGGLIGRVYLQNMDGWRRVHKFVTAASPHRGTMTAKLATHQAGLQMRPDSEFIMRLNSDLTPLQQVRFTSIWSPFDLTIVPANSSVLPVGRARRVWSPAHGVMMFDTNVMRVIAQVLAE